MVLQRSTLYLASKLRPHLFALLGGASRLHSHATSFGFKEVREEDKSKLVGNVFSNVASNYDLMNDMMSAGLHRLWKDRLVSKLNPFPGMKHLDVAGGTGDVAFRVLESINSVSRRAKQDGPIETEEATKIYVCDINPNMLNVGKKRAIERGLGEDQSLCWVQGDAEALSFEEGSMDGYTIAFGIRNVTHIEKALTEAYRVLKRGGRFLCLELSHVELPVFKELVFFFRACYSWPSTEAVSLGAQTRDLLKKGWQVLLTAGLPGLGLELEASPKGCVIVGYWGGSRCTQHYCHHSRGCLWLRTSDVYGTIGGNLAVAGGPPSVKRQPYCQNGRDLSVSEMIMTLIFK